MYRHIRRRPPRRREWVKIYVLFQGIANDGALANVADRLWYGIFQLSAMKKAATGESPLRGFRAGGTSAVDAARDEACDP